MTSPESEPLARLAGALLQPTPERVDRWLAAVHAAVADPTAAPSAAAEPADAEPADAEPADAEPADAQPADAQPADAQPAGRTALDAEADAPDNEAAAVAIPFGRPRRRWFTTGLVAAALAATAWIGLEPLADAGQRPLTLTREQLRTTVPSGRDFGELAEPTIRAACLARLDVAGAEPLAGRPVLLDDRPGVLLVLGTDRPGRLRIVVVDPTCGTVLADTTTG